MLHVQIYYEVEKDDTFSEIAKRFNTSILDLIELNDKFEGVNRRDINVIQVGELIRIQ